MGLLIMENCMEYSLIAELANVYLEDSYVLDIIEGQSLFKFKIDAVLTEGHPRYCAPGPTEQYCYATSWLIFGDVAHTEWISRSFRRYADAEGEEDMGNIDFLKFYGNHWNAGGDWGEVRIFTTARPQFSLIDDNALR